MTTEQTKYVRITDNGVADARRFHTFKDCSMLRGAGEADLETVSDREVGLLGVKLCAVCERRGNGGPALEAIKELLWEIDASTDDESVEANARVFFDGLKERGFYLAKRTKKDADVATG